MAEGDDVVVLNEQIAESAHIATLQKGLEHAVKRGLFRKAGCSYTSVAACGRTFYTKGTTAAWSCAAISQPTIRCT